jgi:hypothetical protein
MKHQATPDDIRLCLPRTFPAIAVANYKPLGRAVCEPALFATATKPQELRRSCGPDRACCEDPCGVLRTWGWGNSELHFAFWYVNETVSVGSTTNRVTY